MNRIAKAFRYAFLGLGVAWNEGTTFKIELLAAAVAVFLGFVFEISAIEFAVVILVISAVLTAEAFNTALEELCDKYRSTHDPHIAKIKDLAAAAVFLMSIGAGVIGIIIFGPHIWPLL